MPSELLDTLARPMVAPLSKKARKQLRKQARQQAKQERRRQALLQENPSFAWYLEVFNPDSPFTTSVQQWAQNGHDATLLAQQAAWETLRYGIFLALSGDAERLSVFTEDLPVLDDAITMGAEYVTAICKNLMKGTPYDAGEDDDDDELDDEPGETVTGGSQSVSGKEAANNGFSRN